MKLKKICLFSVVIAVLAIAAVFSQEQEGKWIFTHTITQKFSMGMTVDIFPSTAEWTPDLLIRKMELLPDSKCVLECGTMSGVTKRTYEGNYQIIDGHPNSLKFRLVFPDAGEIILFLFNDGKGTVYFSYCDAGPNLGEASSLRSSTGQPAFRNHIGTAMRAEK